MKSVEGGITSAKGFFAAVTAAGIKYKERTDMAMIYSSAPCVTAGTFTKNVVKAAPVAWDKNIVENSESAQVVVINAGIANACTGEIGLQYCKDTADTAASALGLKSSSVFVASTGVIGKQLPIEKICDGTIALSKKLSDNVAAGSEAAHAIMTTDTKKKEIAVSLTLGDKEVTIGAMCKGAGMIRPNMCTMLCFITTDVAIEKSLLSKALKECVDDSFNMVSVDGDTSTNDTVLLMANGLAHNTLIDQENEDYREFKEALSFVCTYLAKHIAADGEGATKLMTVKVLRAADVASAKQLARSVTMSSLTKAAVFGNDANWGRILCALGYSGVDFDPNLVDIKIESDGRSVMMVNNGLDAAYSEELATEILSGSEVIITADMKSGNASATAWGCDLSYDYVKINADYRS